jgi:hypothetical protein
MVITGQATMRSRPVRPAAATTRSRAAFDLCAPAFASFSSNNERHGPTYSISLIDFKIFFQNRFLPVGTEFLPVGAKIQGGVSFVRPGAPMTIPHRSEKRDHPPAAAADHPGVSASHSRGKPETEAER